MNCEEVKLLISHSALITDCATVRDGRSLRLQTTFEYPGNEAVDLFVSGDGVTTPLNLTDGGMTVSQLLGFGLDLDATPRRREYVRNVCEQLGIRRDGGEFYVSIKPGGNFGSAAVRLGQACVRICDLIVTHQTRLTSTFVDEIEEGLDAMRVQFKPDVSLRSASGKDVRVDYFILHPKMPSALFGLSAKSKGAAVERVNSTFRKLYELKPANDDVQFITLLDSRVPFWTEEDRGYLKAESTVIDYPADADALRELVTAE